MTGVYAYVCIECEHLATDHRLKAGAGVDGPFRCFCGCDMTITSPTRSLTRLQFDRWMTKRRKQERAS
jgi:hypothetical protein